MECSCIQPLQGTCRTQLRSYVLQVENRVNYRCGMACTGRRLYPCGVLMNTGKPGLARVMRYAPTRSLPRITRQYMPATVIAILMEHAETLPQYTAFGLKSTSGIIMSPHPTRRALRVPSVLILKSHIIGT